MKKRAKKLIALVTALCLALAVVPATNVSASAGAGTINLLQNGSFENVEGGMPTDWSATVTEDGAAIEVQEHGAVLVLNKASDLQAHENPAEVQVISGLEGSVTYVFKAKVMGTENTVKPCVDFRGNQSTASGYRTQAYPPVMPMVPGEWQDIYFEYSGPSDLTKMEIRLINQGYGILYYDDVEFYAKDDNAQTNLTKNGDFENALNDWTFFAGAPFVEGIHYGTAKTAAAGSKAIQMKGVNETSDIAFSQTVSVTAGGNNQFSAKLFKFADSTPYFKVTYFDADENQVGDVQSVDCATATAGAWATVTGTYDAPGGAVTATVTIGQAGLGNCLWDDVKLSAPITELTNGSFENVENEMPTDWIASGTGDGDFIEVQSHNAVLMLNKSSDLLGYQNPAEVQIISGLTGNATYVFKAKVMGTTPETKPCIDFRGNQQTSGAYRTQAYAPNAMVPGVWQEIYFEYTGPEDLTEMDLRLINQGYGVLYCDDVEFYLKDYPTPYNLVKNGDFEDGLNGWSFFAGSPYVSGTHYGPANLTMSGTNSVVFAGTKAESKVSLEQAVAVKAGAEFSYYANVMIFDASQGNPYFTVTHYDADGNVVGEPKEADCATVDTGVWKIVKDTYTVPEGAVTAVISLGQAGIGTCLWDNVQFVNGKLPDDQPKDPATIAAEFRAMLQKEKESATQAVEQAWGENGVYDQPYAGQTNLVLNGDFELNEGAGSNVAEHWNLKEQFSEYASIVEGEGYNGTDCIKFNVPETNDEGQPLTQNPFYDQWIKVVGGAEYQVTYKYKLVCTGENYYAMPTVKLEMWTDQSLPGARHISEANAWARTPEADGEWHTFTQKVYPAVNVVDMQVLARFLANGVNLGGSTTLYIDDVEVVMTRPPKPLDLSTDAVFYYSDDQAEAGKTGTITTSINTGYFPEMANAQIVLEILDPDGNRVWPAAGVDNTYTSVNGVVTETFPLAVLSQKEQRYEVVATLYDTDGTTIKQSKVQNVYVYDRPTSLSEDGVFTKDDGTIFYPEYAYHVVPARSDEYMKLKESGINLVQMGAYSSPEQALADLDKAEAAGIMGFIALYNNMKPAGHNSNIDNTIAIIEAVKDHPALFGYGIMDEVYLNLIDPENDMQASYRLIRSLDPKHPIMTVEAVSSFYEESAKFVDILCIDPYATAESQIVAINTEKAMDAVHNEKPVYVLLEAYRNAHGRFPTPDDIRNNIWQALIQGGSAVGYYSITDSEISDVSGQNEVPIWDAKDGGALWQAICDFNTYEKKLAYDHFVFDKSAVYTESAEIGNPYWYSSWKTEDGDYYIVVLSMLDDEEATQKVSIPLSKDGDAAFGTFNATAISGRIDAEGVGEVITGRNNLNLTLTGWEAVLFKVESSNHTCTDVTEQAGKDATCTEDGYKAYFQCEICEMYFADEACNTPIDDLDAWKQGDGKIAAAHTYGELIPAQAEIHNETELKAAVAAHYFCDACDTYFDADKNETTLDKLSGTTPAHDWADATCTEPQICKYDGCGKTQGEPNGHDEVETWSKGENGHWHQCHCGFEFDFNEHNFGDQGDTCVDCGYERAHAHRLTLNPAVEATCETDGNKAYYSCSGCEDWFEDAQGSIKIADKNSVVIPAGHDYADGVCGNCGAADPDYEKPEEPSVPSTPIKPSKPNWGSIFDKWFGNWWDKDEEKCEHSYESVVTDPTCTKKGYTTHTCSKCGNSYKDSYVDALGHDYENGKCTDCGAKDPNANKPTMPSWSNIFNKWFGNWWGKK